MFIPKSKKYAKACAAVSISAVMLLSTPSLSSAASLLKLGSSGSEVREVQSRLKDLGYFNYSKITGYYGTVTRDAVKSFQASKGLTQDGIVGDNTRKHLFGETEKSSSSSKTSTPILKKGSRGSAVNQLQQLLKNKGYLKGAVDGIFGSGTDSAVRSFQKDAGLAVDGVVGSKTWSALQSGDTSSRGSSSSESTINVSLRKGSRGSAVTKLQELLKDKGYLKGKVDGIFGSGTDSAVRSFQKDAGLAVDGIVGAKTWSALQSGDSSSRGSSSSRDTTATRSLKIGSRGTEVANLQQRLKDLGYTIGKVDGIFGSQTQKAVKAFQKDNGLVADGIAGPKTIEKLSNPAKKGSTTESKDNESKSTEVQMLHWSEVDKLWPRDTYATIIDYDTGKSFRVMRSGGYNHADVETATAEDTAILKSLYGGAFSWSRRAIIVQVNGRSIAASMAGMPHAGRDDMPNRAMVSNRSGGYGYGQNLDAVKGNDMDGVFDIHFYGSKTHGSNSVCSQHQAQVKRAAGK